MEDTYVYRGAIYIQGKLTEGAYEAVTHAETPELAMAKIRKGYVTKYKVSEDAVLKFSGTLYRKVYTEHSNCYTSSVYLEPTYLQDM